MRLPDHDSGPPGTSAGMEDGIIKLTTRLASAAAQESTVPREYLSRGAE